jgi:thiamine kinase-like enzyme
MIATLEAGLRSRDDTVTILDLERESLRGSSSFSTERLRARLQDGRRLHVFFKDLDPSTQLIEARTIREPSLEPSRREHWMYTEVLRRRRHGTPELYAERWDESEGRFWLFLEFVGPKRLSRLGDFSLWVAAARWAGRFHAATGAGDFDSSRLLLRFDVRRYAEAVDRLTENLDRFTDADRATLGVALDAFEGAVERVTSLPQCLLHGEFFGKNVMIRPESDESVAVVDWETAAVGPGGVDLVSISAGRWTSAQRDELYRAYYDEYRALASDAASWVAFKSAIRDVALCQAILWLGYWSRGDDAHIKRWMRELSTVLADRGANGS